MPTYDGKVWGGMMWAGRPLKVLDDLGAAVAVVIEAQSSNPVEKGSAEAEARMTKVRAQRGKPKERTSVQKQETDD